MKFKVGDRVKINELGVSYYTNILSNPVGVEGTIFEITESSFNSVYVKWDNKVANCYHPQYLELIQPEAQEPVPGKFYRTRAGDRTFYVGKDSLGYWVYQSLSGEYLRYQTATSYWPNTNNIDDIVGEWVDEVVLPAVEIKRWAVIFAKDTDEGKRGELLSIHTNVNSAQTFLDKLGTDKINFEIVELTGTLPERKQ